MNKAATRILWDSSIADRHKYEWMSTFIANGRKARNAGIGVFPHSESVPLQPLDVPEQQVQPTCPTEVSVLIETTADPSESDMARAYDNGTHITR
jgi:GTP-dependent phosphoenolpyruvate carboxykinase